MPESYEEIETRIQAAIASILPDKQPNIAKLARDFAVPEARLRARYNGRKARSNCGGTGRSLTDAQEMALCSIIEREEIDGTHLRHWQLQNRANWILAQDHPSDSPDPPPTVGKCRLARFLERHPKYTIQTSYPLANERKWSHDIDSLQAWFDRYKQARENYGIVDQDVWNFDETGFHVGVGGKQLVIVTKRKNPKIFHGDADNREHLTSGEFISGGGFSTEPFVIMKGTYHLEKFYFEGGFIPDTSVGFSDSGYLTNELVISLL